MPVEIAMTTMLRRNREQGVRSSDGCARDMAWIRGGTFRMDWYAPKHEADAAKACCITENPRGRPGGPQLRLPPAQHQNSAQGAEGGSQLCAPNYYRRYRPAARHAEPVDTSTSYVGFAA